MFSTVRNVPLSRVCAGYPSLRPDVDTTSFSEDEDDDNDDEDDSIGSPDVGISPEEERIFVKQDNGQFVALRPSQVMMQTQRSHLANVDKERSTSAGIKN